MASTEPTQSEAGKAAPLGKEGDTCAACGKPLAIDQRYCLNCGQRRAQPRVQFERFLFAGEGSENGVARTTGGGRAWSPLAAAALIALLGIMLLVGVLIGKDENDEEAPAPAAPAGQSATPTTPTTPPTPTTPDPAIPPAGTTPAPAPPSGTNATPTTPTVPGGAKEGTPPVPTSKEGATGQ